MKTKTVVIVMGSPRKNGNSIALAENVAAGIKAAGGKVKRFYLHNMDINPCDACEACRGDSSAECIIDDDMQQLYPDLRQTDALVIASPIYWFTVSAQTKLFMDRCYALGGPQGNALRGKRIGIVLTYGDSDPFNSGCVNAIRTVQDAFSYVGSTIVDIIYGSASSPGEIKANHDLMERAYRLGKQLVADV
ncbi:flavodoxin family protein [Candidatus Pacearchaeota archaeon]|nr:flavodoxin family protein [Candidatus Pacearchaeota archaeon]